MLKLSVLQWRHLAILACSKTFVQKLNRENRMQNRLWNSCLNFTAREIWSLHSPELNHVDYHVWERGQSQSPSSTTKDSRTQGNATETVIIQGTIDRAVTEVFKRLNVCVVAKSGSVAAYPKYSKELCNLWYKHQIWHNCILICCEHFQILGHLKFSLHVLHIGCQNGRHCTVLLQSMTNPSWLAEGALVLAAVSDPISTLMHCPLDMFLQNCLRWRDELHIVVPCKEFPPGLVNVCAFAGSVIQQDLEPLDDAHSIVWYVTRCKAQQQQQRLSEFWQYLRTQSSYHV